jgi:RNA polymerase sigma-70 factor (ECF subfamily)
MAHVQTRAGFAAMYQLHRGPLLAYLSRLTLGDHALAEDLTQEAFLRAWRHLVCDPDNDPSTLRPWLFTVARNLVIDRLRARRARPLELGGTDPDRICDETDLADRVAAVRTVRASLSTLAADQRRLLFALYYEGHTPGELAAQLDIPAGTVKSRSFAARTALRRALA